MARCWIKDGRSEFDPKPAAEAAEEPAEEPDPSLCDEDTSAAGTVPAGRGTATGGQL